MVWKKRLNFGPTACFVPPCIPEYAKGKRSVRNKVVGKKVVGEQLRAFDLLATVAGKLLREEESSSSYKITDTLDAHNGTNAIKKENLSDETSIEDTTNGVTVEPTAHFDKIYKCEPIDGNIVAKSDKNPCNVAYKINLQGKSHALASSNSIIHMHSGDETIDNDFLPYLRDDKLHVNRDDDEKFSRESCSNNHKMNRTMKYQELGQRKIKQHLATKVRKAVTMMTKGRELPTTEMRNMSYILGRKVCYGRQRSSFKRGKYLHRYSVTTSNRGVNHEDKSVLSTSTNGNLSSHGSKDFNVKLTIKSFKVPEIIFEIPKTSTVGSLKATVMEALNAILGNALRVGLVFQGKKVRDDSKTLFQAGISNANKLDDLGFTLEPNTSQTPELLVDHKDSTFLQTREGEPISRFPITAPPLDSRKTECSAESSQMPAANFIEGDHDSIHSPTKVISLDNKIVESLMMKIEPMHMVVDQKLKQIEISPRRIRRPFSVSEVEALVHAVEEFGTGRWKDIKIRAFENAEHRTYVDLKDKWKTLVHTAEISPQQRRGEPVPQELLDRVLRANAYWADQTSKLQSRPSHGPCVSAE